MKIINSFYIFDLRKKELIWENIPGPKEFLLDIAFNEFQRDEDQELLLVGVNKIIIASQFNKNLYTEKEKREKMGIFPACCYISSDRFLVGSHIGKVGFYLNVSRAYIRSYSNGSKQSITYRKKLDNIFITDSFSKVYIL